ncbi:MAG: thiamine-monophosphate kinase [Candidatus Omnitrophica bacterium]|nr:thiamine-monophosphate kinase [Candidatus Omnitrophota bacterium]
MKELQFIEQITKQTKSADKNIIKGIGDDCAVLKYTKTEHLLISTDMLIEKTHFKKSAGYEKIGYKAAMANISDIAAMGGTPRHITIGLGFNKSFSEENLKLLYKGMNKALKKFNVSIIGGDLNKARDLTISITILGTCKINEIVYRSGAKIDDIIFITGPVKDGKKCHYTFNARVKEARLLTTKYKINSMIDVTDGIAVDLWRLCEASGTSAEIFSEIIPLQKGLKLKDALYYGESFELLFTASSAEAAEISKNKEFYPIGVIKKDSEIMCMVTKTGRKKLPKKGFEHF